MPKDLHIKIVLLQREGEDMETAATTFPLCSDKGGLKFYLQGHLCETTGLPTFLL